MNRRQHALLAFMLTLFAAIVVGAVNAQDWPAGTVICSRNLNEADNTTPFSFWNHVSVYLGQGYVVEAQEDQGGVILTRLSDFMARPYQVGVLFPRDRRIGERAAAFAKTQIGRPYRRTASLAPLLIPPIVPTLLHGTPDGESCVSQVRKCYEYAIGRPLIGFRVPDDAMYLPQLFTNQK